MAGELTSSTSSYTREDPYTEAYRTGLFESTYDLVNQQLGYERQPTGGVDPTTGEPLYDLVQSLGPDGQPIGPNYRPEYQVAGQTPFQNQARSIASENAGAFMPYIQGGLGAVQQGQGMLSQYDQYMQDPNRIDPNTDLNLASTAMQGGGDKFQPGDYNDPNSNIGEFYNPYEAGVVSSVQRDFDRMRNKETLNQNAKAIGSGAFGGSRAAVAASEANRNLNEAEGDTLSKIRRSGYSEALTGAGTAFENQQRRALNQGQGLAQLGQARSSVYNQGANTAGNLAQGIGALGMNEAQLGIQAAGQMRQDVGTLGGLGGQDQMQQQTVLDAVRQTNTERQQLPFDMYNYLGNTLSKVPSSNETIQNQYGGGGPSAAAQGMAYGIAALGALKGVS
mgnify:CR=1 FL=1|tara:strand:+ start:26926 stop:28101 length:1176 start_codon:yes stop_codon:yes gene_type:complete